MHLATRKQLIVLAATVFLFITAFANSATDNINNLPTMSTSRNQQNQAAECTNCTICPYPCTHSGKTPPSPSAAGSYYAPPGVGLPMPGQGGNCPPGSYPACCQPQQGAAGQQQGGSGQPQQFTGYYYAPPYATDRDNLAPPRSGERWVGAVMAAVFASSVFSVLSGLW